MKFCSLILFGLVTLMGATRPAIARNSNHVASSGAQKKASTKKLTANKMRHGVASSAGSLSRHQGKSKPNVSKLLRRAVYTALLGGTLGMAVSGCDNKGSGHSWAPRGQLTNLLN